VTSGELTAETRRRGEGGTRVFDPQQRADSEHTNIVERLRIYVSAAAHRAALLKIPLGLGAPVAILIFALQSFAATNGTNGTNTASRNIGIEGSVTITLPRADYQPRPLDDRTELILRVERVTMLASNQHRYDFFYMGLEPGAYKLADYLIHFDGTRPEELGDLRIQVRAMLPEDYDGKLNAYVPRSFPFIGGYRAALIALGVLWAGGIAAFIYLSRKKRIVAVPAAVTPPPSLAERLRPLVEQTAAGKLSVEGQANLERLRPE